MDINIDTGSTYIPSREPAFTATMQIGIVVRDLDATLRPELVGAVLPEIEVTEIAADAPHQQLRLVNGPFGKGSLCRSPGIGEVEARRRANRLDGVLGRAEEHAWRGRSHRTRRYCRALAELQLAGTLAQPASSAACWTV